MRRGICVAGNAIVDVLYAIDAYPGPGELTSIHPDIRQDTGGAMCNVIVDLAKLDPQLPLTAVAQIGDDEYGAQILRQLKRHPCIATDHIQVGGSTSFTAVMCDAATKQRTFFQYRGANALLSEQHFHWDQIDAHILHIGYILLLDALDQEDDQYGTKMAKLLANAQSRGIKTSIDIVSEAGTRFQKLVPPALRYTDYCIINELEAQQATGVPLREGGVLQERNMPQALEALFRMGVSTWAVIHAPEGGYAMDAQGVYVREKSYALPKDFIRDSVGAGDAFCAGVLLAAYRELGLRDALTMGIASATCSLSATGSTGGVKSLAEVTRLCATLTKAP